MYNGIGEHAASEYVYSGASDHPSLICALYKCAQIKKLDILPVALVQVIMSPSANDAAATAQAWLSDFAAALTAHNVKAVAATFLHNGWLRDVLAFTWGTRALEGQEKIAAYLAENLPTVNVSNVKLSDEAHFLPASFTLGPVQGIEFGYIFETDIARGKGFARLLPDENGMYKALTASTIIMDLKGHEETSSRQNFEDQVGNSTWSEYEAARKAKIESNPHVLISTLFASTEDNMLNILAYSRWWPNRTSGRCAVQTDEHTESCDRSEQTHRR